MALEQVIYNLEEVKGFSDEELYQCLCESWGLRMENWQFGARF
jgi:hypothetical protein